MKNIFIGITIVAAQLLTIFHILLESQKKLKKFLG
jgi:hypothetical protein